VVAEGYDSWGVECGHSYSVQSVLRKISARRLNLEAILD